MWIHHSSIQQLQLLCDKWMGGDKTGGRDTSDVAAVATQEWDESGLLTGGDCEVGPFPASNWKCA